MNLIDFSFLHFFRFKALFRRYGHVPPCVKVPLGGIFTQGGTFCTWPYLLNKALNQKKCNNEKLIKMIFTYKKVILDYHNVLFNSKLELKKLD